MTHAVRFVAAVAVLTAPALRLSVQAQTPAIEALRARAEAGNAEAQYTLVIRCFEDADNAEAVRWLRLAAEQGHAVGQSFLDLVLTSAPRLTSNLDREGVRGIPGIVKAPYWPGGFVFFGPLGQYQSDFNESVLPLNA